MLAICGGGGSELVESAFPTVYMQIRPSQVDPMITVTENAVERLQSLLAQRKGDGLRLLVARGGCAGMEYQMKLDSLAEGDQVLEPGGVRIFVDPDSAPFLTGCVLEFQDDLNDSGFKIDNPNAVRSCGCGTSFEPKESDRELGSRLPEGGECVGE